MYKDMKHSITLIAALAMLCGSATAQIKKDAKVYICTSKTAKSYHTNRTCDYLSKCQGEIKQISMAQAIKKGRHLCKHCKSGTSKKAK